MPFIKRYDTLACEVLTSEELVAVTEESKKNDKLEYKENKDDKNEEIMKANEVAELIIFN
jgi:hypothetical protein